MSKADVIELEGKVIVITGTTSGIGAGMAKLFASHGAKIVGSGRREEKGQAVLKVGSTGYSTGPHAHFEVRINGDFANPEDYFE